MIKIRITTQRVMNALMTTEADREDLVELWRNTNDELATCDPADFDEVMELRNEIDEYLDANTGE